MNYPELTALLTHLYVTGKAGLMINLLRSPSNPSSNKYSLFPLATTLSFYNTPGSGTIIILLGVHFFLDLF